MVELNHEFEGNLFTNCFAFLLLGFYLIDHLYQTPFYYSSGQWYWDFLPLTLTGKYPHGKRYILIPVYLHTHTHTHIKCESHWGSFLSRIEFFDSLVCVCMCVCVCVCVKSPRIERQQFLVICIFVQYKEILHDWKSELPPLSSVTTVLSFFSSFFLTHLS